MEIQDIKAQLTLAKVLSYYNLKPDKNLRLHCPFHDDKTPSLQVYYKTHSCYCFSSNCKTHGKSLDVIDFVMYKENTDKHHALLKCVEIIGYYEGKVHHLSKPVQPDLPAAAGEASPAPLKDQLSRTQFLQKMFTYFKNAVHNSKPARDYLQSRCIDYKQTEVGYNAGQFHHGARKDEALINQCIAYGLLLDQGLKARTGDSAYTTFGKWCICFALRNKANEIVSLYFRSTLADREQRHFYLKDRQGLYPGYPNPETTRLILTESIIDAATLLQQQQIRNNYAVLSLFGTNGLTEEHTVAVSRLKELKELIFFLNGDEPGAKAVEKYAPMFKAAYPKLKVTNVEVPQAEDVNSLLQGHSADILTHLIATRKEVDFSLYSQDFSFSNEGSTENKNPQSHLVDARPCRYGRGQIKLFMESEAWQTPIKNNEDCLQAVQAATLCTGALQSAPQNGAGLNANNPYNLTYPGMQAFYQVKGFRVEQMDSLKITLQITLNA